MAQKIIKIPLGELRTVRFVCVRQNCGGVAEIPVERLGSLPGAVQCPSCNTAFKFKPVGAVDALKGLGMVLASISDGEGVSVEFLIDDPDF